MRVIGKMQIKNAGQGIHQREIPGIAKLRNITASWYGYANLEIYLSPGESREIDVFLVLDERILLIDLKDWNGKIETEGGRWFHNGRNVGPSPVEKIRQTARKLAEVLRSYLIEQARREGRSVSKPFVPLFQGCVVITGTADTTAIAANEKSSVFFIDDFLSKLQSTTGLESILGPALYVDRKNHLLERGGYWRRTLGEFFNVQSGPFKPRQRLYGNYRALSDDPTYEHRTDPNLAIYREFDVEENAPGRAAGLLRTWDFSHAAPRFQSENGRREIAGREREVIAYLKDRNADFDQALLQPRDADHDLSVNYWEVFEKRRQLQRLRDISLDIVQAIPDKLRIDLARSLLSRVASLHDLDAAHLDIGTHSVWIEQPSTAKLSHLFAASYPTVQSLAEHRYQFLTAGWRFPEDILGEPSDNKRRDVFLLGSAIHYLLFGFAPPSRTNGDPPEWEEKADSNGRFTALHGWLQAALSWDLGERFKDARVALSSFNAAIGKVDDPTKLLGRLERFRKWPDQFAFISAYPEVQTLKRTESTVIWESRYDSTSVVIKLWKRASWGDDRQEIPRIVNFLERAEVLGELKAGGFARIIDAAFLGDALVIVRQFVVGSTLQEEMAGDEPRWKCERPVLQFLRELTRNIIDLHEARIAHGDLKPANIIVFRERNCDPTPVLIDIHEFSSTADGDVWSSAYAPNSGGRYERDRFAVTKIAEELIALAELSTDATITIMAALQTCRDGPPDNATLAPLLDALEGVLEPPKAEIAEINIVLMRGEPGPLLSDEGLYAVRVDRNGSIVVRGAVEELEVVRANGALSAARRRPIEQGQAARVARFETVKFPGRLTVSIGRVSDLRALEFLLLELEDSKAATEPTAPDVPIGDAPDDDRSADDLAEAVAADVEAAVNVQELWRALIDVEQELYTEGVAIGNSAFERKRKRHVLQFEVDRGTFDFTRQDRVLIQRLRRSGDSWADIGVLDVDASYPGIVVFESVGRMVDDPAAPIVKDGDRLRFKSMMETYSRSRRETATTRILSRQSVLPDLIECFDPSSTASPYRVAVSQGLDDVRERYDLNPDQLAAFSAMVATRPLGLLQGPPGTGKSRFIADLVHFVLSSGMVRNVLLASQSHEAVNNAAEAIMRLFRKSGDEPSLVRVGQETAISADLRPFHSDKIEGQFKDRFRAELRERLRVPGTRLGLTLNSIEDLTLAETVLRPVAEHIRVLSSDDGEFDARIRNLIATALDLAKQVNIEVVEPESWADDAWYESVIEGIVRRYNLNRDRVRRFLSVARMAKDWIGSVSTRQRSFETFLAGTRSIVAGTCVGLGRASLGLTQTRFDLVVIDEAARCTASELAVPMQAGRWVILVGDQQQLEPHHGVDVVSGVAERLDLPKDAILRSDFDRVFGSRYGRGAGYSLSIQYRMLKPIGNVVSKAFYGGSLGHGRVERVIPLDSLPQRLNAALSWVATDALGENAYQRANSEHRSLFNDTEADVVIAVLRELDGSSSFVRWLDSQTEFEEPIGVICTYSAQRDLLRRRLSSAGLSATLRDRCKVDTVDSYQGKQNPIVILSLVRNNAEGRIEDGVSTIRPGFMRRPNRINVAMSRAMDCLIVVGAMNRWASETPLAMVAAAVQDEVVAGGARIIDAGDLLMAKGEGRRSKRVPND
jgi:serine/threonine protein kinase